MRTLVIEDSRLAREGLIGMLSQHPSLDIIGEAKNAEEALTIIQKESPDLLFLDIHMPGDSGFDLLEKLDYTPRIIFTTAYSKYAIQSFDHHTIDYLLKPISRERLSTAIDKLTSDTRINQETERRDEKEQGGAKESGLELTSRIFVKDGDNCHLIKVETIDYCESCKNYVQLFFEGKKAFVKKSLNQIEQRLPEQVFFRANRQFIVNLQSVTSITESLGDGYEVTMKDGKVLEISRRNATRLKEVLSV